MNDKRNSPDTVKQFQGIWEKFEQQHATEGYFLSKVFDIYIPFWKCKQNIVVEKEIELDRFSRIILELVDKGLTTHVDLCAFLGIGEDSFPIIQFHFLLKNDLICEPELGVYEITHEGLKFLKDKAKIKKVESVEFEYFITENMTYLKHDLTQDFFDPNSPIDRSLSEQLKKSFKGYKVLQSHHLNKGDSKARMIPHHRENRPTFSKISASRSDFASFFNQKFKTGVFYDFADATVEAHKRNICFVGLFYENQASRATKLDIRHTAKSVHSFKGNNSLEKKLTEKATQYILKHDLKSLVL